MTPGAAPGKERVSAGSVMPVLAVVRTFLLVRSAPGVARRIGLLRRLAARLAKADTSAQSGT